MTYDEIMEELNKTKFHIKQLADAMERTSGNAIQCLIIDLNFSEQDVKNMYDILDKHFRTLQSGGNIDSLEMDLRAKLDIGYQEVKDIVIAMFKNHKFVDLCREYATENSCLEFDMTSGLYK